jgi:riboflavin biosynthesis pyrimidine reductase
MPRIVIIGDDGPRAALPPGVETMVLPAEDGRIAPAGILVALAERGFHRILIEGGADTVSRFLSAGCLDRLHIVVAPIILGTGRAGLTLPLIERCDEALRPCVSTHVLGDEVLFDCDFSAQRVPVGRAKKSR